MIFKSKTSFKVKVNITHSNINNIICIAFANNSSMSSNDVYLTCDIKIESNIYAL